MFDIGLQELVVIFVIALIVFGPKNLPQLGRSLGRAMREFRRASDEFRNTIETNLEINAPDPPPTPVETPAPAMVAEEGTSAAESPAAETAQTAATVAEETGEPYLAQRGGRLFHRRDCSWVRRIPEAERAYFKSIPEAREASFLSCPACDPWEPS